MRKDPEPKNDDKNTGTAVFVPEDDDTGTPVIYIQPAPSTDSE